MLRFTLVCLALQLVPTFGLSRFSDDTRRISDDTLFDEGIYTNYEAIALESAKVLEKARAKRKAYKPKHLVEYKIPPSAAKRLVGQCRDYLKQFSRGHMPKIVVSPETKKWFKAVALSTKPAQKLGGNVARRLNLMKKVGTPDLSLPDPSLPEVPEVDVPEVDAPEIDPDAIGTPLAPKGSNPWLPYMGIVIDIGELVALWGLGLKPGFSWVFEPILFILWWCVGLAVFNFEAGWNFIQSGYALMQMPTTIGFGDYLPDSDDVGMKLFHATHIMVSGVFASGELNRYIDWIADFCEKMIKMDDAPWKKMLFNGGWLILEMVFSIFYYAAEFQKNSENEYPVDLLDAFYMTIVGLSTVGYGDLSPTTDEGRALGFMWGILGTNTMARFLDAWDSQRQSHEHEYEAHDPQTDKKITFSVPEGDTESLAEDVADKDEGTALTEDQTSESN